MSQAVNATPSAKVQFTLPLPDQQQVSPLQSPTINASPSQSGVSMGSSLFGGSASHSDASRQRDTLHTMQTAGASSLSAMPSLPVSHSPRSNPSHSPRPHTPSLSQLMREARRATSTTPNINTPSKKPLQSPSLPLVPSVHIDIHAKPAHEKDSVSSPGGLSVSQTQTPLTAIALLSAPKKSDGPVNTLQQKKHDDASGMPLPGTVTQSDSQQSAMASFMATVTAFKATPFKAQKAKAQQDFVHVAPTLQIDVNENGDGKKIAQLGTPAHKNELAKFSEEQLYDMLLELRVQEKVKELAKEGAQSQEGDKLQEIEKPKDAEKPKFTLQKVERELRGRLYKCLIRSDLFAQQQDATLASVVKDAIKNFIKDEEVSLEAVMKWVREATSEDGKSFLATLTSINMILFLLSDKVEAKIKQKMHTFTSRESFSLPKKEDCTDEQHWEEVLHTLVKFCVILAGRNEWDELLEQQVRGILDLLHRTTRKDITALRNTDSLKTIQVKDAPVHPRLSDVFRPADADKDKKPDKKQHEKRKSESKPKLPDLREHCAGFTVPVRIQIIERCFARGAKLWKIKDIYNRNVLHLCANDQVMAHLLQNLQRYGLHAVLNATNYQHLTPLHTHTMAGRVEMVRQLIGQPGVDLDAATDKGATALHLSVYAARANITIIQAVYLLMQSRANKHIRDRNWKTARDYVLEHISETYSAIKSQDTAHDNMNEAFSRRCNLLFKFTEVAKALKPSCGKTTALALSKFFGHTLPQCCCGTSESLVVKSVPKTWIDLGKSKNATHIITYFKPSAGEGWQQELVHYVLPTEKLDTVIENLKMKGYGLSQVYDLKKGKDIPLDDFKKKKKDEGKQEKI